MCTYLSLLSFSIKLVCVYISVYPSQLSVSSDDVVTVERAFSLMLRVTVIVTEKQKPSFLTLSGHSLGDGAKNTQQGVGICLRDAFHT
jgi:hypothetical protein